MAVAGISVDDVETTQKLAKRLGVAFPLLSDHERKVTRAFGLHDAENDVPWPAIYVLAPKGKVLWRWVATSYKKRPTVDELLSELSKLGLGRATAPTAP